MHDYQNRKTRAVPIILIATALVLLVFLTAWGFVNQLGAAAP